MVSSSFWNTWHISISCIVTCTSILTSVSAQGMAADYERMEKYSQRIEGTCTQPTVSPHWLPSNDSFWYRKANGNRTFEFVLVDVIKGVRKPAFDRNRLAEALSAKQIKANASSLPFTWINPARDGSVVRFRVGGNKWQFGLNGTLTPYSGDLNEEKLQPLIIEYPPSVSGGESTYITFINRRKTPLSLFWIDPDGIAKSYGIIEAGQSLDRQTYVGHIWRLSDPATGCQVAGFRATSNEAQAIIEEAHMERIESKDDFREAERFITEPLNPPPPTMRLAGRFLIGNNTVKRPALNSCKKPTPWYEPDVAKTYPSPAGGLKVIYDTTPEQKHPVYMIESSPKNQTQPILRTNKEFTKEEYLKPGDRVAIDRPRLYKRAIEISANDSLFQNPWSITDMGWNAEGTEYRFLYNQRGHQILRIMGMSQKGVRVISEEKQNTFIDYSGKTYSYELRRKGVGRISSEDSAEEGRKRSKRAGREADIEEKEELIWASERDGWNHLYLIDIKAGAIKQITKGEWVMRSVDYVDEAKRQIWFKGFGMVQGQDPYYAHLARINFDGTDIKILTEGDGTHSWRWSPNREYSIDTWSRVDFAPKHVLREAKTGKQVTELEQGDLECLRAVDWTIPERFVAPGRDGKTDIYGIIIKPSNFDPSKKYPVIEQIYAGPQDFFVPKAFGLLTRQHEYAELGFIVVQMDGMGTNWRHKAFHDVCYKNLKDAGFPDRIAWMKKAQETRPWMDLTRVGIYGGSAGGQNAMAALLFHGDFYKAAAADSGCHDNRMDKIWWNEQWMGTLDKSYEDSSNVVHAHKLTGALLLIVPELDTNVDPASTIQVINALTIAEKDYELIYVPGANHGTGSSPYGLRRQRDFFVRESMGVQPPKRNGKVT